MAMEPKDGFGNDFGNLLLHTPSVTEDPRIKFWEEELKQLRDKHPVSNPLPIPKNADKQFSVLWKLPRPDYSCYFPLAMRG